MVSLGLDMTDSGWISGVGLLDGIKTLSAQLSLRLAGWLGLSRAKLRPA